MIYKVYTSPLKASIAILLLLLSFSNAVSGQTELTKENMIKIIFNELNLIETNGEIIPPNEIYNFLISYDSLGCSFDDKFYEHGKFIENQYYETNLFFIERNFDSIKLKYSRTNKSTTDVIVPIKDNNGNNRGYKWIFSFDNNLLDQIEEPLKVDDYTKDSKLITSKNEYWAVKEINIRGKKVFLDECHQKYNLILETESYEQSYNENLNCTTTIDTAFLRKNNLLKFGDFNIKHEIRFNKGIWKSKGGYLFLLNEEEDNIFMTKYYFEEDDLIFEPLKNQKITLQKMNNN